MTSILPQSRPQAQTARVAPFQIRGSTFNLLSLKLMDPSDPEFFSGLGTTLALAPGFYSNAPVVLDMGDLINQSPIDLTVFCSRLRGLSLVPVGFVAATLEWERAAVEAGLSVFPAGRGTGVNSLRGRDAPLKRPATRIVNQPVRSGQQFYAAEGDLVVTGPVSRGAELLADGNIHVYGPLRGRALAGMGGDGACRIFCRQLDADLVSIAGTYLVSEQFDPAYLGKSVQIRLDGEKLIFDIL